MKIVKRQMMMHHAVSVVGGFMGGYTIMNHTDIFANAQTGNLIHLVLSACAGKWESIGFMALLFADYCAGNAFYAVCRRYLRLSMKIVSLIVTALSIVLTGFLSIAGNHFLAVLPIAFAMPVQWNAYKTAGGHSSATTFSSNNVRQAVIQLVNFAMDKDKKSLRTARFYWATLLSFHLGVAFSAAVSLLCGVHAVWFGMIPVAVAAVAYYRYESIKIRAFTQE